jgi:hypothetical protein
MSSVFGYAKPESGSPEIAALLSRAQPGRNHHVATTSAECHNHGRAAGPPQRRVDKSRIVQRRLEGEEALSGFRCQAE